MKKISKLLVSVKRTLIKRKVLLGSGTIATCIFSGGIVYVMYKLKRGIHIPTNVLETEKLKAYLYLGKNTAVPYSTPNEESLSPKTRQAIKELVPAPLAKALLYLIDKNGVDLAEDYVSPWSVLRGAFSHNKDIRLRTVEKIAAYTDWNDAEFRTLAQALDRVTLIGLARTYDVDQRLFLPPPPLSAVKKEVEIEDLLRELLIKLPQEDVPQSVRYFTSGALSLSDERQMKRGGRWCFGGNGLNYTREIVPQEKVESFCLQALVKHSKLEKHCQVMVDSGLLQLLQRVRKLRPDNLKIQRNIVRTISNICRFEKYHVDIYRSGWVTLLAEISRSDHAPLRMQASRGLANLDRETMKETFEDGMYLLFPRHRSKLKPEADIVFIHGLMGGAFYTWRQQDGASGVGKQTDCWPEEWIPHDLPGCRVLCVEYDTNLSEWMALCPHENDRRTLSSRSRRILAKMQRAGIGDRPIVFIAHSMGGLIVKHMLTDAWEDQKQYGDIIKRTKGVVFYSTPHYGTQLANYSRKVRKLLFPSIEVMELSQDSPKLGELNRKFAQFVDDFQLRVLSFGEMQATNIGIVGPHIRIHIVPPESADPGVGEFVLADSNHLNICKPSSRYSPIYQQTTAFVRSCLKTKRSRGPTRDTSKNNEHQLIF